MTQFELDVRVWILKSIHAARGPVPESVLKAQIQSAFARVAFTDGDLNDHIKDAQEAALIAGTNDDVMGRVWDLTPKGKIRAQALRA
jgi:hypothetical protein